MNKVLIEYKYSELKVMLNYKMLCDGEMRFFPYPGETKEPQCWQGRIDRGDLSETKILYAGGNASTMYDQ